MRAFDFARRQVELDKENTRRFPSLYGRKRARLLASVHGFLRGSAPLFYEILKSHSDLEGGPEGDGWIVGDMHVENMGAYKTDAQRVVFDINDFDDCTIAPRRYDVLRLATSIVLSGRSFAKSALVCAGLAQRVIEAYAEAAADRGAPPPPLTDGMLALVEKAGKRSKKDLLDSRAPTSRGKRRFVRGERYFDLDDDLRALAAAALPIYVRALGDRAPKGADTWAVEDLAQRIAGTGSLGRIRIAILVRDGAGEERILDFKEAAPASAKPGGDPLTFADRVVDGARTLVENPPKLLAAIPLPQHHLSMIGRQLSPQEDKLELSSMKNAAQELPDIAARVGHILGAAHAHTGRDRPGAEVSAWSEREIADMIDRALELAGLHEAIYLAFARVA